jgi:uncharacterized protein Usg
MSKTKKARQHLMKIHGHKYKRHFLTEGYYCFYCADPADTLDHVPPLSSMEILNKEKRKKDKIPATLVPCCKECNSSLGDRQLWTVFDRLLYLETYYDAFFKKQKAMWTEEEIAELGPSLRESVRHRQEKLERYLHKIRAIQLRQLKPETYPVWVDDEQIEDEPLE